MLAVIMVGVGALGAQIADDPLAAVQRRYPVHRFAVTSTSGTLVHYTLPADAPPELRLAYKLLEVAEREVLTSEALQLLEMDYVNNERKLEALRYAYAAWYLRSPNTRTSGNLGLAPIVQVVPNQGPRFYDFLPLQLMNSPFKQAMAQNIANGVPVQALRAQAALFGLAQAQVHLRGVLQALAHPGRPMPPPPADAAAALRPAAQTAGWQRGPAARNPQPVRPAYTPVRTSAASPFQGPPANAPTFMPSTHPQLVRPLSVSHLGSGGRHR